MGRFVGKECNQIRIGGCDIQFVFSDAGEILAEGDWDLSDPSGMTIDRAREHGARAFYRVHKIINPRVLRYEIRAPISCILYFGNRFSLNVFDHSEEYESFSIQPDGIYV